MELRQLRYFVRIVELRSMSKAAADLYIAQPALSQQIAHLEDELRTKLLSRSARGVAPTDAGLVFYQHAQAVLRQIDRMRAEVTGGTEDPVGEVSVGLPTSVANVLAAPLLAATRERFPRIRLQLTESLSGHLEELLANGRIEMSVLFDRERRPVQLRARPLVVEDLCLIALRGSQRDDDEVPLVEAARCSFVLPTKGNATRMLIDAAFSNAGLGLEVIAELDSLSTIRSLVTRGLAATILSASAFPGEDLRTTLRARRIVEPALSRSASLCTNDVTPLGVAGQCILELIPQVVDALVQSGEWAATAIAHHPAGTASRPGGAIGSLPIEAER